MNHHPHDETDSAWENDAVWKLLDHVPPAQASTRFVDNTVRAAKLTGQPQAWWKRLLSPAPIAGLATATAVIAMAITSISPAPAPSESSLIDLVQAAAIQNIAETEILMAAAENLNDFSDQELVCLIGF